MQMTPVTNRMHPLLTHFTVAAVIFMAVSVKADQTNGKAPFQEKDPGFFQRASNDVGGFFKRLFKTDEQNQPPQPAPPRYRNHRSRSPRYNLDQAPAELRETSTASNHLNSPPSATTKSKDASITTSKAPVNSSSADASRIQEPIKSKPKTQKVTATDSSQRIVSTETAPRPKITKQSETASGSSDKGSVLYSNTGKANTKPPEPASVETDVNPTPPKTSSESSSVQTGSKTGKSGRVKSPYAPYSELDVTGLPSGSLALDPTTQKVFRIP